MTNTTKAKATKAKVTKATPTKPKVTTFTTTDIAKERGINPKTLRARIRRNIDDWQPLFHEGQRHVFRDNKTVRAKVEALLA